MIRWGRTVLQIVSVVALRGAGELVFAELSSRQGPVAGLVPMSFKPWLVAPSLVP